MFITVLWWVVEFEQPGGLHGDMVYIDIGSVDCFVYFWIIIVNDVIIIISS